MGERLKGKVAIVTGSGQGIGKAIALAMAAEGAKVVTNNRRPGSTGLITKDKALESLEPDQRKWVLEQEAMMRGDAETTAQQIRDMGGEAVPVYGNVADYEIAGNLIKAAVDNFGSVDILVNNAGAFQAAPIWDMPPESWHRIVDGHLDGTWNCIRHAAPLMKEQKWGRIINAISRAFLGQKYGCNYSAAKAGVTGLTRAVAIDLWDHGVTCNAFAPSVVTRAKLSLLIHNMLRNDPEINNDAPPETIAPFIVYLATDEAAHISGSSFALRGGHIGLYSEPAEISTLERDEGMWTVDELIKQVPEALLKGYKSKASQ